VYFVRRSFGQAARGVQQKGVWTLAKKRGQHLSGVGDKEQRQFEHIKEQAEKSGRYGDRAEEVAARTVMKHHREEHHKTGQ
jgi:hypothetical protein